MHTDAKQDQHKVWEMRGPSAASAANASASRQSAVKDHLPVSFSSCKIFTYRLATSQYLVEPSYS
jgi:hypothetical protein